VLVPVVRDQHGNTIDGHHRATIADEIGVTYRVDVVSVRDDDEAREIARTLNSDRRQLTQEQRRQVVADLREQGHSLRAIAGAVGVGKSQVERDIAGVPQGTPLDHSIGRDGKKYPARRPTIVTAKNVKEAERAQQALEQIQTLPNTNAIDIKRAERIVRKQDAQRRREIAGAGEQVLPASDDQIRMFHADFRVMFRDIDMQGAIVITDPPYPHEFLPEWSAFAQCAWDAGCSTIVAMTGQSILIESLNALRSAGWTYRWTLAYVMTGQLMRMWHQKLSVRWKPVLVFDRGAVREFIGTDVIDGGGDDKRHHEWGQDVHGFADLIERFSSPGDLIVDPFLGGGTTGIAAMNTGRRFIGCDVDERAVAASIKRMAA
jgi:ParB-like chromosome segregation protein Spo0J